MTDLRPRPVGDMFLGPGYSDEEICDALDRAGARYERVEAMAAAVARLLAEGKVVARFDGRMEFGPRALGARSIIADARTRDMQSVLNLKVKLREGFRPFAPIVLREHADKYFDLRPGQESPYMLLVAPVRDDQRLSIPRELANVQGIHSRSLRLWMLRTNASTTRTPCARE